MGYRLKSLLVTVAVVAAGMLVDTTPSDARGTRATASELRRSARPAPQRAMRSLPRRTAASRAAPRRAVTRAPVRRPVSVASAAQPGTRVAGFAQRAVPRGPTATLARAAIPAANGGNGTFVNGYRDLSFTQFRTGDFFDHPQMVSGQ